ncbi:cyanophycinase [Trichothermofontia sp.]
MPHSTQPAIIVIGGAEDKVHGREILHTFLERSGGPEARIAIIPSASREPALIGARYRELFEDMGAKAIQILDVREREQAVDPLWQACLQDCTGVFMTGGDQLRLCAILADTPIMELVHARVQRHEITLAGTSAGAAVMGYHMIAGGGSGKSPNRALVDMATGFGFLPKAIVDQHFHNRNRMARLISAIAMHPDCLGIGIDEDTCIIVETDRSLQAMGNGVVTIVDATELSHTNQAFIGATDPISVHNCRLHLLGHGDRYHLDQRQLMPSA